MLRSTWLDEPDTFKVKPNTYTTQVIHRQVKLNSLDQFLDAQLIQIGFDFEV